MHPVGDIGVTNDPTVPDVARIGHVIDSRYRVTSLLGRGGIGTVYRAEHVTIKRPVAIKLLNNELRNLPEINERLLREAFATGRLTHPNCVGISDTGHLEDGSVYLVMELLEGVLLFDRLQSTGRLDVMRALHIARHVLRGLAHAHSHGIVHRDLKPENILLVDQDGDSDFAKILDFGIAKLIGDTKQQAGGKELTRADVVIGTPAYMSPEQVTNGTVDGRSDLYSLSIVLYEMIAGAPPFRGEDVLATIGLHLGKQPPRFATELAVPAAVEEMILSGLAKNPADRIPTAQDYLARLEACVRNSGPLPTSHARIAYSETMAIATPQPFPSAAPVSASATPSKKKWWAMAAGGFVVLLLSITLFRGNSEQRFKASLLDIEQAQTCEERRAALVKLRAMGDKRAIPAIKKARFRGEGGVLGIGAKNANACLKEDAEAALEYLEKM
jgi:serine/threonine-protein kinase